MYILLKVIHLLLIVPMIPLLDIHINVLAVVFLVMVIRHMMEKQHLVILLQRMIRLKMNLQQIQLQQIMVRQRQFNGQVILLLKQRLDHGLVLIIQLLKQLEILQLALL